MITNRMAKLRARRTDATMKSLLTFDEAYDRINDDDPIKWTVGTMQPLDNDYTRITFEEGDRVKNQLDGGLNGISLRAEFRYQGSVTNNTHVRVHSDLDLLVIDTEFFGIQPPGLVQYPYQGDPLHELKQLKKDCVGIIEKKFPAVKVDATPSKCIALSGGSLRREIDVVVSNWWNTLEYQTYPIEMFRGVEILDVEKNNRTGNKPFLHNSRIDTRDTEVGGNLRKVIRFLKSLKYDADPELEISSYDISSIAWNMPNDLLTAGRGQELILAENAKIYLGRLIMDDNLRGEIAVPNGTRTVFGSEGATLVQLSKLYLEVKDTVDEIEASLARTLRKIGGATVYY